MSTNKQFKNVLSNFNLKQKSPYLDPITQLLKDLNDVSVASGYNNGVVISVKNIMMRQQISTLLRKNNINTSIQWKIQR